MHVCMYVCMNVCVSVCYVCHTLERGLDWVGILEGRILRGILLRHRMHDKERQSLSFSHTGSRSRSRSRSRSHSRFRSRICSLSFLFHLISISLCLSISKIPQYVYSCILSLVPLASPALLSRFARKFSCI